MRVRCSTVAVLRISTAWTPSWAATSAPHPTGVRAITDPHGHAHTHGRARTPARTRTHARTGSNGDCADGPPLGRFFERNSKRYDIIFIDGACVRVCARVDGRLCAFFVHACERVRARERVCVCSCGCGCERE